MTIEPTNVSEGLLPCPFCGSTNVFLARVPLGIVAPNVACMNCGARGPGKPPGPEGEQEAIAAWNTRLSPPLPSPGVERYREQAIRAVAELEMQREGKPYSRTQEEFYADAAETVGAALSALSLDGGDVKP